MQTAKSVELKTLRHSTKTLEGLAWMSLAVLIWASWLVLTSSGRTTSLSVVDLAGFRAAVPAVVLAPLLWHHRSTIVGLGPVRCLLLSAYGAPFTLFVGYGLGFAPVAHAGAMVPGLMPILALALASIFLGQRLSRSHVVAVLLILLGAATVLLRGADEIAGGDMWVGHLLFLSGAICWASFAVTIRTFEISAFLATAIVGAISTIALLPVWFLAGLSNIGIANGPDLVFQLVFQGVFAGLVSVYAFSRALKLVGASVSTLSALTPGVAALLAVPVLDQIPHPQDLVALCLIVTGLVVGNRTPTQAQPGSTTKRDES